MYPRKTTDCTHVLPFWPALFCVHCVIRKSGFVIRIWTRSQTFGALFMCHLCWPVPFRVHCVIRELGFAKWMWSRPQTSGILLKFKNKRYMLHAIILKHKSSPFPKLIKGHPSQFQAMYVGDLVTVITSARTGTMYARSTVFPTLPRCA